MIAPADHPRESERQLVLRECRVLDTEPEEDFDTITTLSSELLGCPIALISLVDEQRQWFKSRVGLEERQGPRSLSMCGHAILGDEMFVVEDALADGRFCDNPAICGTPPVRFYAGVPLRLGESQLPVGTLCVVDHVPRTLTSRQRQLFELLARQAVRLLELKRERARVEEATAREAETELRLTGVLNAMHDGVVLQDADGAITWANPAACRILGATLDQLSGRTSMDPRWGSVRDDGQPFPGEEHPAMVSLRTGQPIENVMMGVGVEGERRWIRISTQPLVRAGESKPQAVIASFSDVSQLRERERELSMARDAAQAGGRAKSEFLATMSHELRTPLNGVLGMAQLLLTSSLDETQRERVLALKQSGEGLLSLINDILDFSKIEAGGRVLSPGPARVAELIREVMVPLATLAKAKGLELRVDCAPDLVVHADAAALRQVLFNLVGNAIKFTTRGSVTVRAQQRERRVGLSVVDTGMGIAPEHLPRLFQRFSQAENSTSRRFGGTGLGLAISRRLVEAQEGTIRVESEVGRGSSFIVELPVSDQAVPAMKLVPLRERRELPQLRVLLVEDTHINQRVAVGLLTHLGQQVDVVNDGEQALEALAAANYDLVLMDLHMPVMDGLTATRALRAREAAEGRARQLVVALTASAMHDELAACTEAGMDDVATKPLTVETLERALQTAASRRAA